MKDADLHTHSHFSDGQFSPTELIRQAKEAGLKTIALTDHNSTAGVKEALEAGKRFGIEVIPGCEMRSNYGEVLGYFIDPDDTKIKELNDETLRRNVERNRKTIDLLNAKGMDIDYDKIAERVEGAVQRPHIATEIIKQGFAEDIRDAFDRWLMPGADTFVGVEYNDIFEVIRAIKDAGGAAILAHPWLEQWQKELKDVDQLIEAGLDGMEIETGPNVRGAVEDEIKEKIKIVCREKGLIMTRGSDFHGPVHKSNKLGAHNCDSSVIEELRKRSKNRSNREID